MSHHIIIVDGRSDRDWATATGTAVTAREYVTGLTQYGVRQNKVINLPATSNT